MGFLGMSGSTWNIIAHAALFISCSSTLIAMNKHLMTAGNYPHALPLVMGHMATCTVLGFTGYLLFPARYEKMPLVFENKKTYIMMMIPLAAFCAGSFVLSNIAYKYCSVALLQVLKEANVITVFMFSALAGLKELTFRTCVNLAFICIFASLAVTGDMHASAFGISLQLASQMMECVKIVIINLIMTNANNDAIKPLDPLSMVTLVSPVVLSMLTIVAIPTFQEQWLQDIPKIWPFLLANCCMAFVLNCVLALVIKVCSGVGLTLCGVLKDIILVVISSHVFMQPLTSFQWACFMMVTCGITIHSTMENYKEDFNAGGSLYGFNQVRKDIMSRIFGKANASKGPSEDTRLMDDVALDQSRDVIEQKT